MSLVPLQGRGWQTADDGIRSFRFAWPTTGRGRLVTGGIRLENAKLDRGARPAVNTDK